MTVEVKFEFGQCVVHKFSEFEGFIVGIVVRPTTVEYEVLPVTDVDANWRSPVWIDEAFLREKKQKVEV